MVWLDCFDVQISQVRRLNSILTSKESASEVPVNEEARRRLEFFSNSLFMTMPKSPPVRKMFSFRSVLRFSTLFQSLFKNMNGTGIFICGRFSHVLHVALFKMNGCIFSYCSKRHVLSVL